MCFNKGLTASSSLLNQTQTNHFTKVFQKSSWKIEIKTKFNLVQEILRLNSHSQYKFSMNTLLFCEHYFSTLNDFFLTWDRNLISFILTANIPLDRGFHPVFHLIFSCIPKADKGEVGEATVSTKRQVKEHSRNPTLSSFWASMDSHLRWGWLCQGEISLSFALSTGIQYEKLESGGLAFIAKNSLLITHARIIHWLTWMNPVISFQSRTYLLSKKQNKANHYLTFPPTFFCSTNLVETLSALRAKTSDIIFISLTPTPHLSGKKFIEFADVSKILTLYSTPSATHNHLCLPASILASTEQPTYFVRATSLLLVFFMLTPTQLRFP